MKALIVSMTAAMLLALAAPAPASTQTAVPTTKREAAAQWSEDGLQKVNVSGLDLAYARPGATLSGYRKVFVKPVSVSFRRNWERDAARPTGTRVRAADSQKIRDELAQIVHDQVLRELSKGGYQIVESAGDDVLELDLRVVELNLNAPDLPTADVIRTYTMSFGEMTLIADLRDSATGDTVMRILDRTVGRDYGVFRITTRVENTFELRNAAGEWARALRRELDAAKGIGSPS
jgi:hypothetical protein